MVMVKVYTADKKEYTNISCKEGEYLSDVLKRHNININTACNGKGICKKCSVFLLEKTQEEQTLIKSRVLSCQYIVKQSCMILIPEESVFQEQFLQSAQMQKATIPESATQNATIQNSIKQNSTAQKSFIAEKFLKKETMTFSERNRYSAAIDIGTTTLAFALIDVQNKKVIKMQTDVNPQRKYGLDVISRMQSSVQGKREELKRLIWESIQINLKKMLEEIEQKEQIEQELPCEAEFDDLKTKNQQKHEICVPIEKIVISANTAMQHMLLGDSCETLSKAPFTPASLAYREIPALEIFPKAEMVLKEALLILLPGVSAFVGADIVSGLYALNFDKEENALFLDLGTNGEMVLKTKDKMLATATAAGPALEAANISCGMAGIPGAIYKVNGIRGKLQISTIQNLTAKGICGSGVIDLVYELLKAEFIDKTGRMSLQNEEDKIVLAKTNREEEISFTQEDVRQLQMAKAAIRAGMEILMKESDILAQNVEKVYLAGGLGYSLNVFKAAGIGLIAPIFRSKAKAVGNTSLLGAIRFLQEEDGKDRMREIASQIETCNLAQNKGFEAAYIEYMDFK